MSLKRPDHSLYGSSIAKCDKESPACFGKVMAYLPPMKIDPNLREDSPIGFKVFTSLEWNYNLCEAHAPGIEVPEDNQ